MNRRLFASPYLVWMIIFIIVPLLLVLYYAFTTQGPDGSVTFSTDAFLKFFSSDIYVKTLLRSLWLALLSTVICLVVGYPIAFILARNHIKGSSVMILLFIVPMWMNFLLRTYAWANILETNGLINQLLVTIGLPKAKLLYNWQAVVVGMVYNYLPFMILPIYSVLKKMDIHLLEAAEDLGADNITAFKRVVLPLSLPGIISGITMVFMPAVSTFVISRLLGGGQFMLFGDLIEQQFSAANNWSFGSALSLIMMSLILLSMALMSAFDRKGEGGRLW